MLIICNGSEFKNLYPEIFLKSDLEVSKLQMLQTKPQKNYKLEGSILTGLSIRRYESFYECPSFNEIKKKEDPDSLEKKWGVHILFKQAADGSVILGDSHQYATAENIDDLGFNLDMDIDNFMIEEARKIIDLPTYEIQNRWFGMIYLSFQILLSQIFREQIIRVSNICLLKATNQFLKLLTNKINCFTFRINRIIMYFNFLIRLQLTDTFLK